LKLYYSGAIELWGATIPQFSRGRYISSRQVEVYNVGLLFPPPVLTPQPYHRCLYLYNPSDTVVNDATLEVIGPFPPTRPEEVYIALGAQSPTFYVDFLENENASPLIFGVWSTSLVLSIPPRSAFPSLAAVRVSMIRPPPQVIPTSFLRVNEVPVTYVVYSYQSQQVQLPRDLWGCIEKRPPSKCASRYYSSDPASHLPACWVFTVAAEIVSLLFIR
jgi:hypothetical protein